MYKFTIVLAVFPNQCLYLLIALLFCSLRHQVRLLSGEADLPVRTGLHTLQRNTFAVCFAHIEVYMPCLYVLYAVSVRYVCTF